MGGELGPSGLPPRNGLDGLSSQGSEVHGRQSIRAPVSPAVQAAGVRRARLDGAAEVRRVVRWTRCPRAARGVGHLGLG
jgi:hypothetical protein